MQLTRFLVSTRRRKFGQALCALALCSSLVSQPLRAATFGGVVSSDQRPGLLDRMGFTPQMTTLPSNVDTSKFHFDSAGRRIPDGTIEPPFFLLNVTSPLTGATYHDVILGSYPPDGKSSNIGLYVLGWQFKFSNGLETSAFSPSCGDTTSVYSRYLNSPLIKDETFSSNGVALGSRQYTDAFQTAEFHGFNFPSGWRTNFIPQTSLARVVTLTVPASEGHAVNVDGCKNPFGYVNQTWLDPIIRGVIQELKFSHAFVPFSLFNNTVMYTVSNGKTSCCIIGYHSAYSGSGYDQVYGVGSYVEAGLFSGLQDVAALSHETAELTNDPYVNNPTPAWGHIGQVSGCQGNFEVGDPLSGTEWSDVFGGFNYHLQDLAFFSWFYRLTPGHSYFGTGNKYSFRGTFTKVEGTCS